MMEQMSFAQNLLPVLPLQHVHAQPTHGTNGLKRGYDDDGYDLASPQSPYQRGWQSNGSPTSEGTLKREGSDARDSAASTASPGEGHKKKQKRNKPTLSCFECVERKTKACPLYFM